MHKFQFKKMIFFTKKEILRSLKIILANNFHALSALTKINVVNAPKFY